MIGPLFLAQCLAGTVAASASCAPLNERAWEMAEKERRKQGLDAEALALAIRQRLLSATDWIESCNLPVDKVAWSLYRAQLNSAPEQPGWPHTVNWPKPPR